MRASGHKIKVANPETIHLTLRFLGNVELDTVKAIRDKITPSIAKFGELKLTFEEQGYFGSRSRPRVLWIGLGGDLEKLQNIAQIVEEASVASGLEPQKKPFSPHITVARVKSRKPVRGLIEYFNTIELPRLTFTASSIYIKKSTLLPTGAVHEILHELPIV